jgi:hypothetical protein
MSLGTEVKSRADSRLEQRKKRRPTEEETPTKEEKKLEKRN